MPPKYEPLLRFLEAAPVEEPVSITFDELDKLVGGLPPSAREHRPWWGNSITQNRPQPRAWFGAGRRVTEVRLGEAVVFSPADAGPVLPTAGHHTAFPILNGVEALAQMTKRAGYRSVAHAVASHTIFLQPATVEQTLGRPLFRLVRNPSQRGIIDSPPSGYRIMYDDNQGPTLAFLWSAQRSRGRDVQYNHVWGDPRNVATYTALWNICVTPAFLAKTTDGSNHPEVVNLLRYRAWKVFGHVPAAEAAPEVPEDYEKLTWAEPPKPVADLEKLLRGRLSDAPRSRPAISARELGWLFSNFEPDPNLPGK
jgi:hypothetical protein